MNMKDPILIVEDNENNLYLTTFILEKNGYAVIQARTGKEGLDKAAGEKPALILLDIQLPVMDGYEVARRLKESPDTSATPLVAVTSHAMVGDREKILAAGCDGYIEKPIDPETFLVEVEKYLPK